MNHDASKTVLLTLLTCLFVRPTEVLKLSAVIRRVNRKLPTWIAVYEVVFEGDEVMLKAITLRKCGN